MRPALAYYFDLKYEVKLTPIPDEEGGGYCATIPELGDLTFVAEGDNEAEALKNLEAVRRDVFTTLYEKGKDIPLPKPENDFSGKFLIRIPKFLHRDLYLKAKEESTSLNQLVLSLLTMAFYSIVQRPKKRIRWGESVAESAKSPYPASTVQQHCVYRSPKVKVNMNLQDQDSFWNDASVDEPNNYFKAA